MGREVKKGVNDMATVRPDIAKYMRRYNKIHNTTKLNNPNLTSVSGKAEVYCRCENGHEFHQIANKISQLKLIDGKLPCKECIKGGKLKREYVPRKTWKVSVFEECNSDMNKKHLIDEWYSEKNAENGWYIDNIGRGSNIRVYWVCPKCKNVYDMPISDRVQEGRNCPYCSGSRLLKGYNDLASQYPEVAAEWDYELNGDLKPDEVFQHANLSVHWVCSRNSNHKWYAQISHRTGKKPTGCPECKHNGTSLIETVLYLCIKERFNEVLHRSKIGGREYDIYIKDIDLAIEYDGELAHRIDEKIPRDKQKNIVANKLGFDFLRIKEVTDRTLENKYIDGILYRWTGRPTEYIELCEKTVEILNSEYRTNLSTKIRPDIVREAQEQMRTEFLENSFAVKSPEIAKYWHPTKNGKLKPEHFSFQSHQKVWFLCENGHEYEKEIHRTRGVKCNCEECRKLGLNGKRKSPTKPDYSNLENELKDKSKEYSMVIEGSLGKLKPAIAKYWHPTMNSTITPFNVKPFSKLPVFWLCDEGHTYPRKIQHTVKADGRCPICKNQKS